MRVSYFLSSILIGFSFSLSPIALADHHADKTHQHPRILPLQPHIQIALLLDTSNSMDGLIDQAKSQLWTLVNEVSEGKKNGYQPIIELALYEYGNSDNSISKGYIRQVQSLTTDLDRVSEKLFSLDTNGGQEYAGQVIATAIDELEWSNRDQDMKLIIIAGNEPFTQGPVSYKTACDMAQDNHVIIDTIHCGDERRGRETGWSAGANCGGGIYLTINQDEKSVYVPTPYDDDILRLNKNLNKTYHGYGSHGDSGIDRMVTQDEIVVTSGAKSMLSRSKTKASTQYKNENWDLVDAYADNPNKVLSLKETELPDNLKGKTKKQIKKFVEQQAKERKNIQAKIRDLSKQQKDFIAKKQASDNTSKTLDTVLVDAIKKQAIEQGFVY